MPLFPNSQHLSKTVLVTFTCDVRPAIYELKAGKALVSTNITNWTITDPDSVIIDGVWMNGPAVGGWDIGGAWGPDRRALDSCKMWDDGTHGDLIAGDSIYALQRSYDTSAILGQEFKFGIFGCDNEGGYGNNHYENIDDANSTYTLASQFGSIDPDFYSAWDYTHHRPAITAVNGKGAVPFTYSLGQNYPNPFNPSTIINYELKEAGIVTIKVFNLLGQVVNTLVNEKESAGKHSVRFDDSRLTAGVYFYHMASGNFVSTKKMILLK